MEGKSTSPNPDPAPVPVPNRSAPKPQALPQEVKLPSFSMAMAFSYGRWSRSNYVGCGTCGYGFIMSGIASIPGVDLYFLVFYVYPVTLLFLVPVHLLTMYYGRVSHLLPSKPVGRYAKLGLELVAVTYLVVIPWVEKFRCIPASVLATGINLVFHAFYKLRRNSADLGWRDFLFVEVMQFAVLACWAWDNHYAVAATFIVCLIVICYRFYLYSCPDDTSDAPVCIVQKFGSEKAC